MKLRLRAVVLTIAAFLLSSCATLMGPRNVEIPLATLQERLANRFPFNNRYLELLDVTVSNPRLALQPDTNRVLTSMDAAIAPPFLNRTWNGSVSISGNLRFDASRNALVLAQPRVESFDVSGVDARYGSHIRKIGSLLAEQLLQDVPLYTFQPDDLSYGGTRFTLSKITTRPNSLVVTFEPVK
jgi:hypothetical protein